MAIIYTYPVKVSPVDDDLVLISDSADKNNTKQVKISSMRGATVSGVTDVNIGTSSASTGVPLVSLPNSGNVIITSKAYAGTSNVGHVPAGGSATTFLRGDGSWVTPTNTTYEIMSSNNNYNAGLVLAGSVTHNNNFLRKDGTWAVPTNTTYTGSDGITLNGTDFNNTDKGSSQFIFKNIAVSGQNNVVADSNNDTLTLIAGSNITLTTDNSTDSLTIASSGSSDAGGWDVMNFAHGNTNSENLNKSYYYQVVSPSNFKSLKAKVKVLVAGSSSNFKIAVYRGSLSNLSGTNLAGQGSISPTSSGIYEVTLTETSNDSLNLTAGANIILGFFHTQGDKLLSVQGSLSDASLAISETGLIETFPTTLISVTPNTTQYRPCCVLYDSSQAQAQSEANSNGYGANEIGGNNLGG